VNRIAPKPTRSTVRSPSVQLPAEGDEVMALLIEKGAGEGMKKPSRRVWIRTRRLIR
jgi:hypothetical protein